MAVDESDDLAHTATLAAPSSPRTPAPEPARADIESAAQDHGELPQVDPETYVFGGYVARGGMGRIAAVRDKRLGRVVAIKELLVQDPLLVQRFKREIKITAKLQHPAIVGVLEAGRWPTGEPFYAMKLMPGRSLKQAIDQAKTFADRLGLLASVIAISDALAYAHEHSIIHRDLKPANVLVGEFGETVVIDWGLAKDLDDTDDAPLASLASDSAEATAAGSVLGTPAYMAPEQAAGKPLDERTDVYAIGAILYTVLAGAQPYEAADPASVLAKVLAEPPTPLGERQPGVPDDLQAIVARAMARDPAARYPSAKQLAADLKRFQTGQLVAAHKYSRGELFLRWVRRHRGAILVGAAAAVVLAIGGVASVLGIVRERDRAQSAERQASARADALVIAQARAIAAGKPLEALRALADLPLDSQQWPAARMIAADARARDIPAVVAALPASAVELAVSYDGRYVAFADQRDVKLLELASGAQRVIGRHDAQITDLGFSPDGTRIVTGSQDNQVIVWRSTGGREHVFTGHDGWVTGVELSPDGAHAISTSLDRTTRRWRLGANAGEAMRIPVTLRARTLSTDGRWVAGYDGDGLSVWDFTTGEKKLAVEGVRIAAISPAGDLLATGDGRTILVHDVATTRKRVLAEASERLANVEFAPSGKQLIATLRDGTVQIFELATGASWSYRGDNASSLNGIVASQDGVWIAAYAADGVVHVIDTRTRTGRVLSGAQGRVWFVANATQIIGIDRVQRRVMRWETAIGGARVVRVGARALGLAISPDTAWAVTGGPRTPVRVVDVATGKTRDFAGHEAKVVHAAVSPNGALIATLDLEKHVRLFDATSGKSVELPGRAVAMLAFSPDGNYLAAPGDDQTVKLWTVATGAVRSLAGHSGWVAAVAFSADGSMLASVGSDDTVRTWNVAAGVGSIAGEHRGARHVAFAPDGRLATAGEDGVIRLWLGESRTFTGHAGWVTGLAVAPRGDWIASAGSDRSIRAWNVATGEARVLGHHDDVALGVTYAPDGATLASASTDGVVRLWDLATGDHRELRGHSGVVRAVAFVQRGTHIATLGQDGTLRFWSDDLPRAPGELRAWLARALGPATAATPAATP